MRNRILPCQKLIQIQMEDQQALFSKGIYQFLEPVVIECDQRIQSVFRVNLEKFTVQKILYLFSV